MKLAIRIFALAIVVAGTIAAYSTPKGNHFAVSHQSAPQILMPQCAPNSTNTCGIR